MAFFIFFTFRKMLFNLDDKNTTEYVLNMEDETDMVNYNET